MLRTMAQVPHRPRLGREHCTWFGLGWAGLAFLGTCENEHQALRLVRVIFVRAIWGTWLCISISSTRR